MASNACVQPRRLRTAPTAVGCKRCYRAARRQRAADMAGQGERGAKKESDGASSARTPQAVGQVPHAVTEVTSGRAAPS